MANNYGKAFEQKFKEYMIVYQAIKQYQIYLIL